MEASVVKGGDLCLRVNLSRSEYGIKVNVKTSALIENFMRSLGPGEKQAVDMHGKLWIPEKPGDAPLYVYEHGRNALQNLPSNRYSIAMVGRSLDLTADLGPDIANLSFLRLVGISEGNGVTFHVKGQVLSLDGLRSIKNRIGQEARNLYVDFIRPVDMTVYVTQISSQEMQG